LVSAPVKPVAVFCSVQYRKSVGDPLIEKTRADAAKISPGAGEIAFFLGLTENVNGFASVVPEALFGSPMKMDSFREKLCCETVSNVSGFRYFTSVEDVPV